MCDCLKANNAQYCDGDTPRQRNVPFFSPDKAGKKFADLSGNQLPTDFKRLIVQKPLMKFTCPKGLDWAFAPLSHYIFFFV